MPTTMPVTPKAQLVADERQAEAAVIQAEYDARKAELTNDPDAIALGRKAVDDARTESLKIRAVMTDGLAQWHEWDSQMELQRTAKELGISP
jgi:hypothetical protein